MNISIDLVPTGYFKAVPRAIGLTETAARAMLGIDPNADVFGLPIVMRPQLDDIRGALLLAASTLNGCKTAGSC